jgi:hypothetical protein
MTWLQFKTAVKELLTVDGVRVGVATSPTSGGTSYLDRMTQLAVVEVLSHVDYYVTRNTAKYTTLSGPPSGFLALGTDGNASTGFLPGGASALVDRRIEEAYRLNYETTTAVTASPSATAATHCNRTPVENYPWANRNDMICAHPLIRAGATLIAIGPGLSGGTGRACDFYLYPSFDDKEVLEVAYTTSDASHSNGDTVPYDLPMAEAVSEYCKAKITREVDKDLKLHDSYYSSFRKKRQELYINSFGRERLKDNVSGGSTRAACSDTTTSSC